MSAPPALRTWDRRIIGRVPKLHAEIEGGGGGGGEDARRLDATDGKLLGQISERVASPALQDSVAGAAPSSAVVCRLYPYIRKRPKSAVYLPRARSLK